MGAFPDRTARAYRMAMDCNPSCHKVFHAEFLLSMALLAARRVTSRYQTLLSTYLCVHRSLRECSPISLMAFDEDARATSMRTVWSPSDVQVAPCAKCASASHSPRGGASGLIAVARVARLRAHHFDFAVLCTAAGSITGIAAHLDALVGDQGDEHAHQGELERIYCDFLVLTSRDPVRCAALASLAR